MIEVHGLPSSPVSFMIVLVPGARFQKRALSRRVHKRTSKGTAKAYLPKAAKNRIYCSISCNNPAVFIYGM
jgi:hypothetical protein